jgi:hypothetical protein
VIPVLFLSVNILPVYRALASARAHRKAWQNIVALIPAFVLFFGAVGEITALKNLAYRTAAPGSQPEILWIMILLTAVAASGPTVQFASFTAREPHAGHRQDADAQTVKPDTPPENPADQTEG